MRLRVIPSIGTMLAVGVLWFMSRRASAADAYGKVYDVPRVNGIVIDGAPGHWQGDGFMVSQFAFTSFAVPPAMHFNPHMRLAWDERGLLVLAQVDQDSGQEYDNVNQLYQQDSIEIFVSTGRGEADLWQAVIAPGFDPKYPNARLMTYDFRRDPRLLATPLKLEFARTKTATGYVVEALLPWKNLGITPKVGREIGFRISIHKYDGPGHSYQTVFYPATGAPFVRDAVMRLRLWDMPAPPLTSTAFAGQDSTNAVKVTVVSAMDAVGKQAQVLDGTQLLGSAVLAADGPRALATIALPMPRAGSEYGRLRVTLGAQELAVANLPNPQQVRQYIIENAAYRFDKYVFAGANFPLSRLEHPDVIHDAISDYTISLRLYSSDFKPVQHPTAIGRYGALITIRNQQGMIIERRITLYHAPAEPGTGHVDAAHEAGFLAALGIDVTVAAQQSTAVSQLVKDFNKKGAWGDAAAVFLARLYETTGGTKPYTRATSPWAVDHDWWYGLDKSLGHGKLLAIIRTPQGYDARPSQRWPLIVFLHGAGRRGADLTAIQDFGPANQIKNDPHFGFITAVPLCPADRSWRPAMVNDFIDDVCARYRVDPDRICLTGGSLGGNGTWATACRYPGRFAAIAPLCAWGDPAEAPQLAGVSTWIFHGAKDDDTDPAEARNMYNALVAAHGHVRFTLFTDLGHIIGDKVYERPEFYDWLSKQRRGHSDMVCVQEAVAASGIRDGK